MRLTLRAMIGIIICSLAGCISDKPIYAPVSDISTIERIPSSGVYRVTTEETLYSVAWRYGLDYRYLAKLNHINPARRLLPGQVINLKKTVPAKPMAVAYVVSSNPPPVPVRVLPRATTSHIKIVEREPTQKVQHWLWPAHGKIVGTYSTLNKGINIGGQVGNPVYATAAGKVVYNGNGLRGYGNLIIIKHNTLFLSAYANNNAVFVKEGDWVNSGQKIAEMGSSGARRVMLHFEIRRSGEPVDPLNYLVKGTAKRN